jgi:hypothetical protein
MVFVTLGAIVLIFFDRILDSYWYHLIFSLPLLLIIAAEFTFVDSSLFRCLLINFEFWFLMFNVVGTMVFGLIGELGYDFVQNAGTPELAGRAAAYTVQTVVFGLSGFWCLSFDSYDPLRRGPAAIHFQSVFLLIVALNAFRLFVLSSLRLNDVEKNVSFCVILCTDTVTMVTLCVRNMGLFLLKSFAKRVFRGGMASILTMDICISRRDDDANGNQCFGITLTGDPLIPNAERDSTTLLTAIRELWQPSRVHYAARAADPNLHEFALQEGSLSSSASSIDSNNLLDLDPDSQLGSSEESGEAGLSRQWTHQSSLPISAGYHATYRRLSSCLTTKNMQYVPLLPIEAKKLNALVNATAYRLLLVAVAISIYVVYSTDAVKQDLRVTAPLTLCGVVFSVIECGRVDRNILAALTTCFNFWYLVLSACSFAALEVYTLSYNPKCIPPAFANATTAFWCATATANLMFLALNLTSISIDAAPMMSPVVKAFIVAFAIANSLRLLIYDLIQHSAGHASDLLPENWYHLKFCPAPFMYTTTRFVCISILLSLLVFQFRFLYRLCTKASTLVLLDCSITIRSRR